MSESCEKKWWAYLVWTKTEKIYTGITLDVERRFKQHCDLKGAKFFFRNPAEKIIYREGPYTHSEALKRERQIKKMPAAKKRALAQSQISA